MFRRISVAALLQMLQNGHDDEEEHEEVEESEEEEETEDYDTPDQTLEELENSRKRARSTTNDDDDDDSLPNVSPPKLKRTMSNSERKLEHKGGWHLTSDYKGEVNLQTPGEPDHTYSAVAFNIHGLPTGNVLQIKGFSVRGDLCRIRVYICPDQLCHTYRENKTQWACIYDSQHKPAWEHPSNVIFQDPVIIAPEATCAFYIHSDCRTDRGLMYRSCRKSVVFDDQFLAITRGFAHTSPIPFDPRHGWYREQRVLSGNVFYEAIPIRWTNYSHSSFPLAFQECVFSLRDALDAMDWHEHIVDKIIEFFPFDHFGVDTYKEDFLEKLRARLNQQAAAHHHYHHWY